MPFANKVPGVITDLKLEGWGDQRDALPLYFCQRTRIVPTSGAFPFGERPLASDASLTTLLLHGATHLTCLPS